MYFQGNILMMLSKVFLRSFIKTWFITKSKKLTYTYTYILCVDAVSRCTMAYIAVHETMNLMFIKQQCVTHQIKSEVFYTNLYYIGF